MLTLAEKRWLIRDHESFLKVSKLFRDYLASSAGLANRASNSRKDNLGPGIFKSQNVTNATDRQREDGEEHKRNKKLLDEEYKKLVMTIQQEHPLVFDVKVYSQDIQTGANNLNAVKLLNHYHGLIASHICSYFCVIFII